MKRHPEEDDVPSEDGNEISSEQQDSSHADSHSPKKKKIKHSDSGHDFSSREISKLKETEALFHSSLFRLQVNELLKEVALKQKLRNRLSGAVEKLNTLLKKIPSGKEHKISDHGWLEAKGIQVPFLERPSEVKGTFQYLPPSDITVSGSVALDIVVKPHVEADLVLLIPKECFQPKDYVNQRCIRKQAFYLAVIASYLKKKKQVEHLRYSYHQGNPLKPVLNVTFKGDDGKCCRLCLHTAIETETFKLSRFHVEKNNVRPNWFFEKSGGQDTEEDAANLPPTPFYNLSVLQSLCCSENDRFLEKMLKGSDGVRHGLMLLKVWLRQRQQSQGLGGFSNYLLNAVVTYLLIKKTVNKLMNSYQVFRAALLYLSKADWTSDSPSLCEQEPGKNAPSKEEFQASCECTFIDRTGFFNLAYTLSAATFKRISKDAQVTIEALDANPHKNFDVAFMIPMSFPRKFDYIFHIKTDPDVFEAASEKEKKLQISGMDVGGHQNLALKNFLEPLFVKALDERVKHVQSALISVPAWDVSEPPYDYDSQTHLTFGLTLDSTCAFNALDKGPLADAPEAKEFREFWGKKSEMRRFKDGTIHEGVLWSDSANQCDRRLICQKIVEHVLERHSGILPSSVSYMGGQLDSVLSFRSTGAYGTGEEQSLAIIHAFDDVNRSLRALSSLPLAIHSVQGTHPVFRHADVFPALPTSTPDQTNKVISGHSVPQLGKALPTYTPALNVICMLEGSGKWPEEKDAIQCMKALLHTKMGMELKEKHQLSVGIHPTHVDVLKDGFIFRIKLANTRELAVLRTIKTESGMVKFKDTEESMALEKEIVNRPLHTQLLHGIQQEHPVFSASVRLCKRWLGSQMAWDFLLPEALELIVAYIFISPQPFSPPSSPWTGFLRFLHLLSTFNWETDPLMVNLNKEFTDTDWSNVPKEFRKNRATLPSMCLCTPQNKQGTCWTRTQPSAIFLQRLVLLARESMNTLENQMMEDFATADFKQIFRPPLQHYDLLIKLLRKVNVLHHQQVDSKTVVSLADTKPASGKSQVLPVVEFNVCKKFYQNLKEAYGDIAMFFFDPFGGDVIGMVWRQQALEKKEFKPSCFNGRRPVLDENQQVTLEVAKEAILDDIRVLGGGIVESISPPVFKEM